MRQTKLVSFSLHVFHSEMISFSPFATAYANAIVNICDLHLLSFVSFTVAEMRLEKFDKRIS